MTIYSALQQEAARELLWRRAARKSFTGFCEAIAPDEPPAEHHKLICEAFDDVVEGKKKRIMIFMPPGSAKSTYATVRGPAYYLGRTEKKGVICASYADQLASSFGRKVRNLLKTQEYQRVFPGVQLSEDSKAKGEWETQTGGFYYAAGVGGGVTGRRADLAIIDDPIKGRKDADSETIRNSTWEWYKTDLRTRLKPNGAIIFILTRWHEDDPVGRILPESWKGESGWVKARDGEDWYVICLPAQARKNDILNRDEGEWLWPEWFTPDHWEQERRVQSSRDWNALYQQTPTPDEGSLFKREWFKRFHLGDEPSCHKYLSSDYAVTKDDGDYTELGIWGTDAADDLYALDWWYGQETSDVWIESALDLINKHKPLAALGETGVIRRAIEPQLNKRSRERKVYFRQQWITRTGDKVAMARPFQARASMGKVYIPYGEWGDRLINQLCAFPAGTYDDAVDNAALIGLYLDETHGPSVPEKEKTRQRDSYGLDDDEDSNWKAA